MHLIPKKIKYSSRTGLQVEYHEPGGVWLTFEETCMALLFLASSPSKDYIDEHFSPGETAVIQRYLEGWVQASQEVQQKYKGKDLLKTVARDLKTLLGAWVSCPAAKDMRESLGHFFGWHYLEVEPESRIDHMVQAELREPGYSKQTIEKWLKDKSLGKLSQHLREEVERRYGPLNLDSI